MRTTGPTTIEGLDSPSDVLVFARACRTNADRAEADLLAAAVIWAEQHPPESIDEAATWIGGGEEGLMLAGPGAPMVAEFAIAEFAAAIGLTTDSGKAKIAYGLELKYRLPKHWARVQDGTLQSWRACRVAEATVALSAAGVAFVDAQLAPYAHRIGYAALDRLIAEAINRFMPDLAEEKADKAAEGRHITFHHDQVSFNGTTHLEAELDLADALDLDAALSQTAEQLKVSGSRNSLDVRRAMAVGEIARRQLALDLNTGEADAEAEADHESTTRRRKPAKPRQVVLYVHLSEAAIRGEDGLHLARVENTRTGVTAEQVKGWCANPGTTVVVKPVIDLTEHIHVSSYEVPDRLAETNQLRDLTCVFPWCNRPAKACDSEHCVAHDRGGTTCGCNTAPVCRRHHRLKTHSAWTYTTLEPGSFLWTSPHGWQFLRDHHGTVDVSAKRPPPRAPDAPHFF